VSPNRKRAERVLILAPTGRDALLASDALSAEGVDNIICESIEELCAQIEAGAGAAIITQEALTAEGMRCLRDVTEKQPAWSDFPLLIFTSQPSADLITRSFDLIGTHANVTLMERPIRVRTLVTAARAALRARRRQYEVHDLLTELENRVRERDQFLAMLSHELRNPLAAISLALAGNGDGQRAGNGNAEHDILMRQTHHLTKLVDDLLDIGRVTSGKIVLHRTNVDFADIVVSCAETFKVRAAARGLTLNLHLNAEKALMSGDAVRLEQVVTNLLSNAIKYTPEGGTIDVTLEQDGGQSIFRVRDTGKGISPELLNRIFDLFMQGDVTIDRSEGGMGIGLTLVRKLVELHGGSVRALSKGRGEGSEFVVRLPLREEAHLEPKVPEGPRELQPRHIVVVEDNRDVRDLLLIRLRHMGHRVDAARDGTGGVETILSLRPDIALIDIGLPGIDGYEVARRVRQELGANTYLVALTGYGQADDRQRAIEAGFDVHLTKPANLNDLQKVLAGAAQH